MEINFDPIESAKVANFELKAGEINFLRIYKAVLVDSNSNDTY
jgi:hypothetical protein